MERGWYENRAQVGGAQSELPYIAIFNVESESFWRATPELPYTPGGLLITSIEWHPTNPSLIMYSDTVGRIYIYNVETEQFEQRIDLSIDDISQDDSVEATWSRSGDYLAVAQIDHIRIYERPLYQVVREFSISDIYTTIIQFNRDETYLMVADNYVLVIVNWQHGTMQRLVEYESRGDRIEAAVWSPIDDIIAYGGQGAASALILQPVDRAILLPPTDLRALYAAYNSAPVTPVLHPSVVIRNHGNTPVPLSEVRLDYELRR